MKLFDNLIKKSIEKQLKEIDFKAVITSIITERKDEIAEAIQSALCKLLNEALEKVKTND